MTRLLVREGRCLIGVRMASAGSPNEKQGPRSSNFRAWRWDPSLGTPNPRGRARGYYVRLPWTSLLYGYTRVTGLIRLDGCASARALVRPHDLRVATSSHPSRPHSFSTSIRTSSLASPFNPCGGSAACPGTAILSRPGSWVDVPVLESGHGGEDTLWRPSTSGEQAR